MDYDTILLEASEKMDHCVEHLQGELRGIRTGRASPGLVDSIKVDYYGSPTPLGQMAQISVPEARQIVIKPFDATQIAEVAKAIQASDLGINPNVDGKILRLNVPPLSEERRKKLVGLVKERGEAGKIAIRNVRRDANKHADAAQKDGNLSEDDLKGLKEEIQEQTKTHEGKVDEFLKNKIEELTEV
ncbi:MAG: ribosome recycling factor [Planctomycetota bacterium]|jgi:ribosome recycling factor